MPTWTVLQHIPFEHPGLITDIAAERGVGLDVRRLDLGAELPRLGEVDGLVAMGGPMGKIIRDDRVLGAAGSTARVLHWHEDTFGVPPGAQLLARSTDYPHQAFRSGPRAYGLQFHVEINAALARDFVLNLPEDVLLPRSEQVTVEAYGREAIGHFFDLAL